MSDSPAETTPSPPAPAMPITRSFFIVLPFADVAALLLRLLVFLQPGRIDLLGLALLLLRAQPLAALVVRARALLGQLLGMAVEAVLGFQARLPGLLLH